MDLQTPTQELDPAIHGALLRLLQARPEDRPETSKEDAVQDCNETPEPESVPKIPHFLETGQPRRDCGSCAQHDEGWCYDSEKRTFYSIQHLKACPLDNSEQETLEGLGISHIGGDSTKIRPESREIHFNRTNELLQRTPF